VKNKPNENESEKISGKIAERLSVLQFPPSLKLTA
jgi:hypothetical protein